jgi:signal transduction histidine kinase
MGGRSLAERLLVAQVAVLIAGAVSAAVAATLVGPAIFHDHLVRAGHSVTDADRLHMEEAFGSAGLIALAVAGIAALLTALAVTWYLTRGIRHSLGAVTSAAAEVQAGRYDVQVPAGGGTELDALAAAFTAMAARLGSVEETRRRLLTDLSHELRTPIATLDGYLEGLEDGVVTWNPETAALLRGQTARLARLAGDLREVSQAEEGVLALDRTDVDAADLLDAAAAAARDAYRRKGVALVVEPAPSAAVGVDRQRLAQVLGNLLGNALRHTPAGGTVRLGAQLAAAGVRLNVVDDGEGIAAEHLPHVFERFYRADTAREHDAAGAAAGTGVGLTISKALVEAHGGRLTVTSPGPGLGSEFAITLPRNDSAARG